MIRPATLLDPLDPTIDAAPWLLRLTYWTVRRHRDTGKKARRAYRAAMLDWGMRGSSGALRQIIGIGNDCVT